jgi:hypothetical protein
VDGITDSNSDAFGTLTLLTTKHTKLVTFKTGASSFNKGITVQAMGGIVLSESVTTRSSAVVLRAGTGTLTVQTSKTLSTSDQLLRISTDDVDLASDLAGGVSSGAADIILLPVSADHQTSLGVGVSGLLISDDELGRLSTSTGVNIGSSDAGVINVGGITDSNSDSLGLLTLIATRPARIVEFTSSPSFFNRGITVRSTGGVVFNSDATTKNSQTIINCGTGTITVAPTKAVSSSNQLLIFTSDDIDFGASSTVSTGTAALTLTTHSLKTIGVGTNAAQYDFDVNEFLAVDGGGMTIGQENNNLLVNVIGITDSASTKMQGIVSIISAVDDHQVIFNTTASTFHAMVAQADNGVKVDADLTTTAGIFYLDGDFEDSSTADSHNNIVIAANKKLQAKTFMTLEATTGTVIRLGTLTLAAGRGIDIRDTLTGGRASEPLVIHAGFDANIDGTFTVAANKHISSGGQVFITAMDIDLLGGIQAANSTVAVHTSGYGRTVGVGFSTQQLQLDASEIQRLTSTGLSIGGLLSGSVTVGGVSELQSNTITGIVSLMAVSDDAQVIFSSTEAAFSAVAAQADNGIVVGGDMATRTGDLTLDGDIDNSSTEDDNNKITMAGDRILRAAGKLTLDSTSGGIERTGAGTLQLIGGDGVVVSNDIISVTANQPLIIHSDYNLDGFGTATVKAGQTINTNNGELIFTAADVDLGNLLTGTAATSIGVSKPGLTIGVGLTSKDLTLSGPELQGITATGLNIGSPVNAEATVDGVEAQHSASISEVLTIMATDQTKTVTFTTTRSTFNTLAAVAGNGVNVNSGVTTIAGDALFDGDSNKAPYGSFGDRLIIASEITLTAYETLTLDSQSGGIINAGALSLSARNGVVLNDNMSGQQIERTLQINADVDSNGIGAFTVKNGISVNSKDSRISITAADIDVLGSLSAGTQGISLHASGSDRTIGLGSTTQDMHLADAELGNIVGADLTVGTQWNGDVLVNGVQDASTSTIGVIEIVAMKPGRSVTFVAQESSFNKGITVQAASGVVLMHTVTTKNTATTLRAGTGTLTVLSTKAMSTSGQDLLITADDIDLQLGSSLSAGSGVVTITPASPQTIGVGVTTEQMDIEFTEIQRIQAGGLTIGTGSAGSIVVEGVTEAASSGITDFVSFVASVDDSRITFSGAASTFAAVGAQADNGITVSTTIIATTGYMYLDGDMDKDNRGDAENSIVFTDGLTVAAKTTMTLQAITGSVLPNGALTLQAGSGINIFNDITTVAAGKALVFDADHDSVGDGVLSFLIGKILNTNGGSVDITAADIEFGGPVTSNAVTLHTSIPGGTMALGTLPRNMTISSDDLQTMNTEGFVMGNSVNGDITVSGVTARSSNNVLGVLSLVASGDNARVIFDGTGSTFNAIAVQADNGIDVFVDISTDVGMLSLNGDVDGSNTDDFANTIAFSGDTTLRAEGLLLLNATSSGMQRAGAGTLTLSSGTGIIVSAGLNSTIDGQATVINADDAGGTWSAADTTGGGILTVAVPASLNTQDGQLTITASDIDILGNINTGTSTLLLTVSKSGAIVGLGATSNTEKGFTLSGEELQRITSSGLTLGNEHNSSIEVDGITDANSQAITGIVSLVATSQNAAISFLSSSSTFSGIAGTADDGIDVEKSLTTTLGSIILNGDADNSDDGKSRDYIYFISGLSLVSNLDIDLQGATGGVKLAGPVNMQAKRHINIYNAFTGPFGSHAVTVTADSDNDGVGIVSVASAACSIYHNAASCITSRICSWCGSEPTTIGDGLVTTTGGDARDVRGTYTSFTSDTSFAVGNLLTVDGQSRQITAISSDTSATVESKFLRTPSGFISVYAVGGLDQVVGSARARFDKELQAGYTVTVDGTTAVVASVESYKSFTTVAAFPRSESNALYMIGNISGSGSISTDSGQSVTVTGSWPPSATKFLTQLQTGASITVGSETRTVESVLSNQLLTVTTPFTNSFASMPYTISNVAGTASISFDGSTLIAAGSDVEPTKFTEELAVGDVIIVSGQTKMVQTISNDHQLSVSSVFSTPLSHSSFQIGNVHDGPFTLAQQATGTVHTSGSIMYGVGTYFAGQLEVGFKVLVKINGEYEQRSVQSINTETQVTLDSPFSTSILSNAAAGYFYQTCPSQGATLDESIPGTFSLHAKTKRPNICYNTGRCTPRASHKETFETIGQGIVAGTTSSTTILGTGTDFLNQLQHGYSISVYTGTRIESRKVVGITSATICEVDMPFSFDITFVSNTPFLIHYLTGTGQFFNAGGANYTVYGTNTHFMRELAPGYVIAVGNEKRLVTTIASETEMTVSAPFNYLNGGVGSTGFVYEACMSGGISTVKQIAIDYTELDPGCCGFKSVGAVAGSNFAYYKVVPPSTNYNLRVVTTSDVPQLEVYMRYTYAPDAINYDFKAVGTYSPWQIELPQDRLRCPANATSCDSLWVGIRGLGDKAFQIAYEVAAYLEFNFPSFACDESTEPTLSQKCAALGLRQLGHATFVNDETDVLRTSVMRLTSQESSQTGAVWYTTKVHLENGFETSFRFKMSSECTANPTTGCGAADGFAFVIHGGNSTTQIGCGGRALGFASNTEEGCTGITQSFAVEFDTWHNPELRDINLRGAGTMQVNASTVPRYNYVHAAFFSNGKSANTNSHDGQLAGTPAIPTINDGDWHMARVVYIPGTSSESPGRMFLYINDMQSFVLTAPIRLTKDGLCGVSSTDRCVLDSFGNAYLGFSAGTGEIGQSHDISKWLFCDEPGCGRE